VAYREALFADETPYAAMEAMLPEGSKAEARLDGKESPTRNFGFPNCTAGLISEIANRSDLQSAFGGRP
jgi:hypothetical protein